jgi:hypothetical protein
MRSEFLFVGLLAVLIVSGCTENVINNEDIEDKLSQQIGYKKYKEYVLFESSVLDNSETCGSGKGSGGCVLYVNVSFRGSSHEAHTGIGSLNCRNNFQECYVVSGFKKGIGEKISIEGVYDNKENYLKVLGTYEELDLPVPDKEYFYEKVLIKKVEDGYCEGDFSDIDTTIGYDDISSHDRICAMMMREYRRFYFDFKGREYNFSVRTYRYYVNYSLDKLDDEIVENMDREILFGNDWYIAEVGFEPVVGDSVIIEGFYDDEYYITYVIYGDEIYRVGVNIPFHDYLNEKHSKRYDLYRVYSNTLQNKYNIFDFTIPESHNLFNAPSVPDL